MIAGIALILCFQLGGEVVARGLGLPVPGPVIGMAALVVAFLMVPRLFESVRSPAEGILSHLALLFVPAGVGIVGHWNALGTQGGPILLALAVSTVLAIAVGALTFVAVARLAGAAAEGDERAGAGRND
ncbi:CidA/LrgA family protein [Rhodobacteraceae bacterium WD3A24]|nr:CidA/LrgA family protein [Rhodobacteraceae bacterium WD3A24]